MTYKVKGSSIRTKLAFVEEHFGVQAKEALLERVDDVRTQRVLDSGWYPFELYVDVLRAIVEQCFRGDTRRLREVGRYSAREALSTTYKSFVANRTYAEFLGRVSSLHHLFYSGGRSQMEMGEDGLWARIVLSEKPELAEEDLHIALGFYLGAGELCGHPSIRGDFEVRGGEARFDLRWDQQDRRAQDLRAVPGT